MNWNLIRSILAAAVGVVSIVEATFGCATNAITSLTTCSVDWLPPKYVAIFIAIASAVHLLSKSFMGGAVGTGLVAKTVPVVASGEVGTVTSKQVETGPRK